MSILLTIIIGLTVGAVAKALVPGPDPGGFLATILLGVAGAVLAAVIGQSLGWYLSGQPVGLFASILGAMILLFLYRFIFGKLVLGNRS